MSSSDKFLAEEMSAENLDEPPFCWGKKKGVGLKDKGVQFYESFTFDGVEYALYDSIYMYDGKRKDDPHIGMLVKIWETARSSRKIKVQWFFQASEISYWLRKYNMDALDNELFLATGDGVGLENINSVEAIAGKCSVICISTDSRNPQPSAEQLKMAEYVFYRTFDVGKCVISERMGDKVGGLEVKYVFNQHNIEMVTCPKVLPKPNEKHDGTTVAFEKALQISDKDGFFGGCVGENPEDASERVRVRKYSDNKEDQVEVATKIGEDTNSLDGGPSKEPKVEGSVQWSRVETINLLDKGPKISIKGLALASDKEDPMGRKSGPVLGSSKGNLASKYGLSGKDRSFGACGNVKVEDPSPVEMVRVGKNSNTGKNQVEVAIKFDKDSRSLDGGPFKKPKVESKASIVGFTLAPTKENPMGRKSGLVGGSLKVKLVAGKTYDITRRPSNEKGKWFNSNPWDVDSMRCAQDERRVILVENLDPRYTSRDVEDILWSAFQINCTAKVVQRTAFSSSLYGRALAILKTRDAAERVVVKLNEECLLISGKRALTASVVNLPKLRLNRKKCNFVGHLSIDRIKLQREQKDARATSHHSQANTIEYELALEWCLLQSRHELSRIKLHKCHVAELSKCAANFKATARAAP